MRPRRVVPTAIVFMPVKSVTVADPPKTSIELTIMLVARLDKSGELISIETWSTFVPKEHENKMSCFSPSCANNLKPRMCIRRIELELGRQLRVEVINA